MTIHTITPWIMTKFLSAFRQVSWIRRKDLAILTSNTFVYTTDTRFSVIHINNTNSWDLRIKSISEKDSGVYECQINTEPKVNFPIYLEVISKYLLKLNIIIEVAARWNVTTKHNTTHSSTQIIFMRETSEQNINEESNNLINFHPFNIRLRCSAEWGRV